MNWVGIFRATEDIFYSIGGGNIPIRKHNVIQGCYPKLGKYPENKWTGLVLKDEMPYVINPDKGYVVSANNFMTSTNVLHGTSHSFTYTGRSTRIHELLEEALARTGNKVTAADMQQMQKDVVDVQAKMSLDDMVYCAKQGLRVLNPA